MYKYMDQKESAAVLVVKNTAGDSEESTAPRTDISLFNVRRMTFLRMSLAMTTISIEMYFIQPCHLLYIISEDVRSVAEMI